MKYLSDMANSGGKNHQAATTPTVNVVNSDQIQTLLHIAICLTQMLNSDSEKVDRNARDSACATYINTTNRLDSILQDDKRWQVESYDKIVESLQEMYNEQKVYMEKAGKQADKDAALKTAMASPHNRGTFFALNNGEFLCCDGDPSVVASIKATGISPLAAAAAFDDIWEGRSPYQPFSVRIARNVQEAEGQIGGGLAAE